MFLLYIHANAVNNNKGNTSSGEQTSGLSMEFSIKVHVPCGSQRTNLVASRHIKRERASLPVDACSSKTCLLNLPNKGKSKLQSRFSCYYNNGTNQCTVITGPNLAFFHDKSVPTL